MMSGQGAWRVRAAGLEEWMATGYWAMCRQVQMALGLCILLLAGVAQAQGRPAATAPDDPPARTVLVMGDSLSAAYGLRADQGWVDLLANRIESERPGWRVVNASISGETSAGGSSRIAREVVRHQPAVVVIALGANDALRGLPLSELKRNLARMIGASEHVGARVLLVGMHMPPNLGAEYTRGLDRTYRDLARSFDIPLLPFLLEPIAADRGKFMDDNLHPVAEAQPAIRDHVWPALAPLLR
jgi:acyl-CoA thioesterase-1